jgi:membrane protein DedA with SNARE-associated domain
LLILGFRFLYGLRTVTPFVLGSSKIAPLYFMILNILGAFIWTIVIGVIGYMFGHAAEMIIGNVKRYELWFFIGLAALGVIIWSVHLLFKKKISANKPVKPT